MFFWFLSVVFTLHFIVFSCHHFLNIGNLLWHLSPGDCLCKSFVRDSPIFHCWCYDICLLGFCSPLCIYFQPSQGCWAIVLEFFHISFEDIVCDCLIRTFWGIPPFWTLGFSVLFLSGFCSPLCIFSFYDFLFVGALLCHLYPGFQWRFIFVGCLRENIARDSPLLVFLGFFFSLSSFPEYWDFALASGSGWLSLWKNLQGFLPCWTVGVLVFVFWVFDIHFVFIFISYRVLGNCFGVWIQISFWGGFWLLFLQKKIQRIPLFLTVGFLFLSVGVLFCTFPFTFRILLYVGALLLCLVPSLQWKYFCDDCLTDDFARVSPLLEWYIYIYFIGILLSALSFYYCHFLSVSTLLWPLVTYFCCRSYCCDYLCEKIEVFPLIVLLVFWYFSTRILFPTLYFISSNPTMCLGISLMSGSIFPLKLSCDCLRGKIASDSPICLGSLLVLVSLGFAVFFVFFIFRTSLEITLGFGVLVRVSAEVVLVLIFSVRTLWGVLTFLAVGVLMFSHVEFAVRFVLCILGSSWVLGK